jgi:DNA-directed RNA polymerase subunit RPC12/RpoP
MAWEKIVQRVGVGACPKCLNIGFDYQAGANPHDDERAAVECPACGWRGIAKEMVIAPEPKSN